MERTPTRLAATRRTFSRKGRGEEGYTAAVVTPPSTTMVWPVMKLAGVGGEVDHGAGDLVGLADAAQRRGRGAALEVALVFPQRAGEIGLDQAGRDAVDANVFRAPFAGEVAAERKSAALEIP